MNESCECLIFHSKGVTAIKFAEAAFDSLLKFFRDNHTENDQNPSCQLEIVMNAGQHNEHIVKFNRVWQIVGQFNLHQTMFSEN